MRALDEQTRRQNGAEVARRRRAQKWSQARLAREVGIDVGTVSRLERGLIGGSAGTQVAIARVFGAEVHEVFSMPSILDVTEVAS